MKPRFLIYRMGGSEGASLTRSVRHQYNARLRWYSKYQCFHCASVSPHGEFIRKFLWSSVLEQWWRHDHFLMHSYILCLYYLSGPMVGIGPGGMQGSTRQTEISMVQEPTHLTVVTR